MKKTKTRITEEVVLSRLIVGFSVVAFLMIGVWAYFIYNSVSDFQMFTDTSVERYQTDRVEMALARDFVEKQLSASSTITYQSRDASTFYFQGEDVGNGAFMFIIEQVAPAQFEIKSGISSINTAE